MQVSKLDDREWMGTCLLQTWRTREKMKTVSVTMAISLNVGVEPPRHNQDPALCQTGVLGGPSHPQVGQVTGDE